MMSPDDVAKLKLISSKFELNLVRQGGVIDTAVDLVVRGVSTPSVDELAGIDLVEIADMEPRREIVIDLLSCAFEENGEVLPSRQDAGRIVVLDICSSIVNGDRMPVEGANAIWDIAYDVPDMRSELTGFIVLASDWDDVPSRRKEIEDEIFGKATEYIKLRR